MNLDEALDPDLIGFDGYGNVTLPREAFEAVHAAGRQLLALTETAPSEFEKPTLVWIDYDVSVYGEHDDGWLSVDGDAIRLRDTR